MEIIQPAILHQKKNEKIKEVEKLLEKYDIMPSYYAYGDKDLLQITGDDINRIDDTMTRSLTVTQRILELSKKSYNILYYK